MFRLPFYRIKFQILRHIQHDITTVQKYTTNTYEKLIWNDRPIDLSSPKQF